MDISYPAIPTILWHSLLLLLFQLLLTQCGLSFSKIDSLIALELEEINSFNVKAPFFSITESCHSGHAEYQHPEVTMSNKVRIELSDLLRIFPTYVTAEVPVKVYCTEPNMPSPILKLTHP